MKMLLWISCCLLVLVSTVASAKIVFDAKHNGNYEIYVMNDDGSRTHRVTNNLLRAFDPRWSPDGKQIAFVRKLGQKHPQNDLFVMNVDGSNVRQLTHHPADDGYDLTWAPDGKRLAFVSFRSGNPQIHVLDVASGTVKQLTADPEGAVDPAWSPAGRQIAYRYTHHEFGETIYTMSADGSNQKPLIPLKKGAILRFSPAWAPDGQRIVFCEMEWEEVQGVVKPIVIHLVIHHIQSKRQQIRKFPRGLQGACWMGNAAILVSAIEDKSDKQDIYRYHIASDTVVNLTNTPEIQEYRPHWVDDSARDVSSLGRKSIQWGEVKSER